MSSERQQISAALEYFTAFVRVLSYGSGVGVTASERRKIFELDVVEACALHFAATVEPRVLRMALERAPAEGEADPPNSAPGGSRGRWPGDPP